MPHMLLLPHATLVIVASCPTNRIVAPSHMLVLPNATNRFVDPCYTVHVLLLAHATTVIAFKLSYDTNVIIITVFGKNSIVAVCYKCYCFLANSTIVIVVHNCTHVFDAITVLLLLPKFTDIYVAIMHHCYCCHNALLLLLP